MEIVLFAFAYLVADPGLLERPVGLGQPWGSSMHSCFRGIKRTGGSHPLKQLCIELTQGSAKTSNGPR